MTRIRFLSVLAFLLAIHSFPAEAAQRAMVVTVQHLATDVGLEILKLARRAASKAAETGDILSAVFLDIGASI